ncbi:MAG: hypothetical protein FH761_03355 [Firmicutes bacterium]|nr:hypothetical protein [Bacillota bacterium]
MKKILAYLLLTVMILSAGVPTFADGNHTMEFSLDKTDYSIDEYIMGTGTVYFNGSPLSNSPVTMVVRNDSGKAIYDIEQYTTNSEGEFSIKFRMSESAKDGTYYIELKSYEAEKTVNFSVSEDNTNKVHTMEFNLTKEDYDIDEYITGTGRIYLDENPLSNAPVTMVVKNDDGKAIYDIEQYTTDSEGRFNVKFRLSETAKTGTYHIELKCYEAEKIVDFNIRNEDINIELESLSITANKNKIKVNNTIQLTVNGKMSDGSDASNQELSNVIWSSSDDSIATVSSSGLVTGKGKGSVVITASIGDISGTFNVTVEKRSTGGHTPSPTDPKDSNSDKTEEPEESNQEEEKVVTQQGTATITTDSQGNITTNFVVDNNGVMDQIQDNSNGKVTIDASTDSNSSQTSVNMSSKLLKLGSENNTALEIKVDDVSIVIEPDSLKAQQESQLSFNIKKLSEDEKENIISQLGDDFHPAAYIFDFSITSILGETSQNVELNKPLTITMEYDSSKVIDPQRLGIYYYNEELQIWEYIGGRVTKDGEIEFTVDHFSKYTAIEYRRTFNDIADISWAQRQIEVLSARHIINGIDEESYAPRANITGAAFAKLIVEALDLEMDDNSVNFSDVNQGDWYQEPVEIAASLGIVTGHDGKFNPNGEITREQMAVMLIRALKYVKPEEIYTVKDLGFNDKDEISDWAKEEVTLATNKGLIKGLGDGTFGPQEKATRAQSAVVIYRLLDLLNRL